MVVVDVNVLGNLLLPGPWSLQADALLEADSRWIAPPLWRSELRNVLTTAGRLGRLDLAAATALMARAEALMRELPTALDSVAVLRVAKDGGCSAYDAEYVVTALNLGLPLVTADSKLARRFPGVAVALRDVPLA